MRGARGHGAGGAGVVLRRRDGHHRVPVAVGDIEAGARHVRPGPHRAGARAVVGAVGGAGVEQVEHGRRHVPREGEAAQLVVHDRDAVQGVGRVGDAVREPHHGAHEVAPVADHPGAAQHVVPGAARHGEVARRLGLAVGGEGREGLPLVVHLARAVEDVVAGDVHEGDAVLRAGPGEKRRPGRVRPPAGAPALGGLCPVDRRVGAAVDHGAVEVPVVARVGRGVRHVEGVHVAEVEGARDAPLLGERPHGTPQLAVAARDERPPRRHGDDVREIGMMEVGLGDGGLGERDRPLDAERGVRQAHEGVRLLQLRGPVGVHQVGVDGAVLQRLEGVADPARDVDGPRGVEPRGVDPPVGGAPLAQVHPRAEDGAAPHGDELVPGLGVHAAGDAALRVEGDVVLHDAEVGDAERDHLGPLPVLLEPAAGVAVDGELHHPEPLDRGVGHLQFLLELEL